ncbi:ABC transporter ATP-binding protein [uncultured Clostridium sp.]|uniref:ABC transporter ATP-binding protein n=1 Tax=uncultured Clostridium sp. TaxID=59620 RepID=UPI0025E0BF6A|nr:ABC transporter ATP-binding protein [uncultured Clostridium sp.]
MFGLKNKKEKLEDINSHIEADLANSKIHVKNVSKIYHSIKGDTLAMDNISLNILENEFVCIVGPSGCGKSTLLKMICGLDEVTSGSIVIHDKEIIGPGPDRGMVFQSYTLFPWMTVEENIRFGLKIKKMPKEEQDKIVDKYLKVIKLEKFRNSYPKELSGGMKQRVAIARALANSPEVLLMDEPFGALDPQTKADMQLLMREIWQVEKPTIVFVTHDIDEAVFLATKIDVLTSRPGRLKKEIQVYLPYNRTLELKNTEEFVKIKADVQSLINNNVN